MAKKKKNITGYVSIKIKEEHYVLAKSHKEQTGVNIDFFIGKAIEEKLQREKFVKA